MMDLQIMAIAEWVLSGEETEDIERSDYRDFNSIILQEKGGFGDSTDICQGPNSTAI